MEISRVLERQRLRLLQIGMGLLVYSSLEGFAIPYLGSPRIGLSVHTLSAYQGVLLLTQGFLWTRLNLGVTASWIAFWCSLHGAFAILAAYTVAAVWGVGNETIQLMGELPRGLSHGTAFQETFIKVLAYSSAPTGLAWLGLVLWGLRIDSLSLARQASSSE
jgi:hydroxylaminobenzene mutase